MKKYIIGTVIAIIILLSSIVYRNSVSPFFRYTVPVSEEMKNTKVEIPIFIYVFLSKQDCTDCMEMIETLNGLPGHFVVIGIVNEHDLADEVDLRIHTGVAFPLISSAKYKKYAPWYSPSIIGTTSYGDILFILPGVPGGKKYIIDYLEAIYRKTYPILLKEKIIRENKTLRVVE